MSTQTKTDDTKVPKLRFPGFSGDWEEKKLGSLGSFKGGGTPSKKVEEYWNGTIPWISSSDIIEDNLNFIHIHRFINDKAIHESATKVIPPRSLLLVSRVGVGKLAINESNLCTSQDFTNFIPEKVYCYFLGFYFQTNKKKLLSFNQGTSIKGFTKRDVEGFPLTLPSDESEQEKIADFLTAVDSWIQTLKSQKENLEYYKKGIMQKIFSQEIRFKDDSGKDFPEWEERKLGEVAELITKGTTPTSLGYKFSKNQHVNFIKVENISNKIINIDSTPKVSLECHQALKRSILQESDILFSIAGTLGRTAIVEKKDLPANTNQALAIIRLFKTNCLDYIHIYLNSNFIKRRTSQLLSVGAQPNLSLQQISSFKINLPSLPEQEKIADFLSSIDELIQAKQKQIEKAEEWKKGLMQQLFI